MRKNTDFMFFSKTFGILKIAIEWLLVEETLESWVSVPPCTASKWFIQSEQSSAVVNRVVCFSCSLFYMIFFIHPNHLFSSILFLFVIPHDIGFICQMEQNSNSSASIERRRLPSPACRHPCPTRRGDSKEAPGRRSS